MNRRLLLYSATLALGTASCLADQTDDSITGTSSPVIGGNFAAVCEWPSTVMLPTAGCTGTLVHSRVVMTAKHCLDTTPASVSFGETRGMFPKTVKISKCYKHPQTDFGFCVLAEDVTGVPIIPVMAACEQTELKMGASIVEAGFGDESGANNAPWGHKKWIPGTLVQGSATRTTVQVTSGTQDGEYFGDSGGPVFIHMPDGTWRLIGNDLTSPDWNASGKPRVSTYTSVPYHVAWAEQQSGIDITPCHDAKGWNPGPGCVGSPTDPGKATGTWATMCDGQQLQLTPTCGGGASDGGVTVPPIDAGSPDSGSGSGGSAGHGDASAGGSGGSGMLGSGGTPGSGGNATGGAGGNGMPGGGGTPGVADGGTLPSGVVTGVANEAGCSCSSGAGASTPPTTALGGLLLSAALLARRRRRR